MIFIDSNIPMYLVGAAHRHKAEGQIILERLIASDELLVTSAEVFQEVIHRYVAINRREAIQPAFQLLLEVTDRVYPVEKKDALRAAEIVLTRTVPARDALHIAVMERYEVSQILSFDPHFDGWPGVRRIHQP